MCFYERYSSGMSGNKGQENIGLSFRGTILHDLKMGKCFETFSLRTVDIVT